MFIFYFFLELNHNRTILVTHLNHKQTVSPISLTLRPKMWIVTYGLNRYPEL